MTRSYSLWLAIGVVVGLSTAACSVLAANVGDPDPARFDAEIGRFEAWDHKNAPPRSPILFVGSSSIRLWQTANSFPELAVINRGFGGSHVSDVNHFAGRIVLKYAPQTIVFYAGDNDIAGGKPPVQIVDDTREFVNLVHRQLPEASIVYLPVKPSMARWNKWPQMSEVNSAIERLAAADDRLVYVDTATVLLGEDGRPRSELFLDDGLHLNPRGYAVWNDVLRPVLVRDRR